MIKFSIIIVSYNNIKILKNCLDSIKQFNDIGDELEVIVSDNSSDNNLFNEISEEYKWIKIIKNENHGFGAGNNRGFEVSSGEYLLFLNPDTIFVEPILKFAAKKFELNKDLALFGVQLIKPSGKLNASFFTFDKYGIFATLNEKLHRKFGRFTDGKMFICGADMFVRRQSFVEAGLFDENIFMYKEEADLIKRIKLQATAKKTAFFKNKKIIHLEGGTEETDSCKKIKVAERLDNSDRYYANKWGLNYKKILKDRIRYCRFKRFIFLVLFKKNYAKQQKQLIDFYTTKLNISL